MCAYYRTVLMWDSCRVNWDSSHPIDCYSYRQRVLLLYWLNRIDWESYHRWTGSMMNLSMLVFRSGWSYSFDDWKLAHPLENRRVTTSMERSPRESMVIKMQLTGPMMNRSMADPIENNSHWWSKHSRGWCSCDYSFVSVDNDSMAKSSSWMRMHPDSMSMMHICSYRLLQRTAMGDHPDGDSFHEPRHGEDLYWPWSVWSVSYQPRTARMWEDSFRDGSVLRDRPCWIFRHDTDEVEREPMNWSCVFVVIMG